MRLLSKRQKVLNAFESRIFLTQNQPQGKGYTFDLARITQISDRTRIKILTTKQTLKRLPISNTHEKLLNEIQQIIYFLYQTK